MSNFRAVSIIFILGSLVHRKSQCLKCNYEKTCDGLNFEKRKFTDCDVMEIAEYNRLKANQKNDLQANVDAAKNEANEYILKKQAKLMELIKEDPRIDWKTRDIKMENSKNYKIIIRLTPRLFDQERKTIRQKPVNEVKNVEIVKARPNNDSKCAPSKTARMNPDPPKGCAPNHGSQNPQPDNRRPLRTGSPNQSPQKSGPPTRSPQNPGRTNRCTQYVDQQNLGPQNLGQRKIGPQNFGPKFIGPQHAVRQNLGPQNLGQRKIGPQNFGPKFVGPQHAVRQNLDQEYVGPQNNGPQYVDSRNLDPQNFGPPNLNQHNNISTTSYQSNYAQQNYGSPNAQDENPRYAVPINNSNHGAQIANQAPPPGYNRNNLESRVQIDPNAIISQAVVNPSAPYIHYETDAEAELIHRVAGDPQSLPYVMDEIFYTQFN